MRAQGRTIEWQDFVDSVNRQNGTAILERIAYGKFMRWWWTPDDLYAESAFPIADWSTMREDAGFDRFTLWCHRRYTSAEIGKALMVCSRNAPARASVDLWLRMMDGNHPWVEIVPLHILPKNRRLDSM